MKIQNHGEKQRKGSKIKRKIVSNLQHFETCPKDIKNITPT